MTELPLAGKGRGVARGMFFDACSITIVQKYLNSLVAYQNCNSITGKELVQSVINGVIDGLSPFFDQSILSSVKTDQSDSPLLICACGQQPDALDDIM